MQRVREFRDTSIARARSSFLSPLHPSRPTVRPPIRPSVGIREEDRGPCRRVRARDFRYYAAVKRYGWRANHACARLILCSNALSYAERIFSPWETYRHSYKCQGACPMLNLSNAILR